ncbi:tetratricopeptide repeat protein [Aporhodopirellula aestuarii]|uniref:Tetratricopeptide repeat protein n=1 Tax=Aporhodopirellula aestuarii TaxID=2950107 RepID=A0ABT0U6F6_9BACT|nr:tetratricopeptide repeat protein [Aporhodopirellula aestuarii]MCM2372496.1 tetratricopeptide repeat protein [Aporhodopirellula aestuarii]
MGISTATDSSRTVAFPICSLAGNRLLKATFFLPAAAATLTTLLMCGCAAKLASIDMARDAFVSGDLAAAETMLSEVAEKRGRFSDPAKLDLAVVQLAAGNVDAASARLRALRDRFDETSEANAIGGGGNLLAGAKAAGGSALSMVTDDTSRVFKPAGYEEVMIRTMLAICSLAGDGVDAESYINQAAMHQAKLRTVAEERQKTFFPELLDTTPHQELAFAPYLRGVLREATHHDFDDAQRNYRLVSSIKPDFRPAFDDLERATVGNHSRPGHGVLYVFAMVGRGPVLVPTEAPVTSAAVAIASTLLLHDDEKDDDITRLPKITSVKIPTVVIPPSPIAAVTVAGAPIVPSSPTRAFGLLGATQSLTDVGALVQTQADAERPWTIARSFVRQAGKEMAVGKVRETLGITGGVGSLFQFAASSAWTATETADTRCWGLLPREIQVLRAELPVGDHAIRLAPVGPDGFSVGHDSEASVRIDNGRNTYLVVVAPAQHVHVVQPRREINKSLQNSQ